MMHITSWGVTYSNLGHYKEAIEAFKDTIRIKSDCITAYVNLGAIYGRLGNHSESIKALEQAIHIKPDDINAHYNLGIVYLAFGDKASALKEYKILKDLDQESATKIYNKINSK